MSLNSNDFSKVLADAQKVITKKLIEDRIYEATGKREEVTVEAEGNNNDNFSLAIIDELLEGSFNHTNVEGDVTGTVFSGSAAAAQNQGVITDITGSTLSDKVASAIKEPNTDSIRAFCTGFVAYITERTRISFTSGNILGAVPPPPPDPRALTLGNGSNGKLGIISTTSTKTTLTDYVKAEFEKLGAEPSDETYLDSICETMITYLKNKLEGSYAVNFVTGTITGTTFSLGKGSSGAIS